MVTYSVNIGSSTEATTYPLIGATATDLSVPLSVLYDNTIKDITPGEIRNAILTLWSNSVFTQTTKSGIEYVGIDTNNPSDRDLKNKIYLGKRAYSATFSYSETYDIMTYSLLNNDEVDVFLFNTKIDTLSNAKTRLSILAGTNSVLHPFAPFIQSEVVTSTSSLSLDIINPTLTSGDINVLSSYGTVSLNTINLPSYAESSASASNDKLWRWNTNRMEWDFISLPALTVVGSTGSVLNLYGSPVYVNGYPLEFTDDRPCPIEIGDIQMGTTFSEIMSVELLRRIVYDYLSPIGTLSVLPPNDTGYVEVGSQPQIKLKYSIFKRTLATNVSALTNMIPSSYPAITSSLPVTITGTASGVIISPVPNTTFYFSLSVSDVNSASTVTASVSGIYPYFYGFSSLSAVTLPAHLLNFTKSVTPFEDKSFDITGSGNLYFIYDATYPNLSLVYDNNLQILTLPTPTIQTLSSPTGLWASKQFKIYKFPGIPQVGPPSVIYQFKY